MAKSMEEVKPGAIEIEYDPEALGRIEEDFASHPGTETGGILLGVFAAGRLRITSFEAIPCPSRTGPQFVLSGEDLQAFEDRVRYHNVRARSRRRRVVGWYRTQSKGNLAMRPDDLALHEKLFTEPWQVALLLTTRQQGGMDAKFFLKEEVANAKPVSGNDANAPLPSVPAPLIREKKIREMPKPVKNGTGGAAGNPNSTALATATATDISVPGTAIEKPVSSVWLGKLQNEYIEVEKGSDHARRARGWGVWAALLALAALSVAGVVFLRSYYAPAHPRGSAARFLRVETVRANGNIEVLWDPTVLANSTQGLLDIQDGGVHAQVVLDPATLASGKFTYAYKSDVTGFRLHIDKGDGSALEGSTTFVAPPPGTELADNGQPTQPVVQPEPPKNAFQKAAAAFVDPIRDALQPERGKKPERRRSDSEERRIAQQRSDEEAARLTREIERRKAFQEPPPKQSQLANTADRMKMPDLPAVENGPSQRPTAPMVTTQVQASVPPPPAPTPVPAAQPPTKTVAQRPQQQPQTPLNGHWILQPGSVGRAPAVPESIAIKMTENGGSVHGTLEARVKNGSKRERVSLTFNGRMVNGVARVPWTSSDGKRGEIEFIRVPNAPDHVEVVWYGPDSKQAFDAVVKKMN